MTCYVFMRGLPGVSGLRVICVARVDVDMVVLSCYYVPHWYVSF
jgi:hypothetical protein